MDSLLPTVVSFDSTSDISLDDESVNSIPDATIEKTMSLGRQIGLTLIGIGSVLMIIGVVTLELPIFLIGAALAVLGIAIAILSPDDVTRVPLTFPKISLLKFPVQYNRMQSPRALLIGSK